MYGPCLFAAQPCNQHPVEMVEIPSPLSKLPPGNQAVFRKYLYLYTVSSFLRFLFMFVLLGSQAENDSLYHPARAA
jgi:hypothetical protein